MKILSSPIKVPCAFLFLFLFGGSVCVIASPGDAATRGMSASSTSSAPACEDFAQRQIKLAEGLVQQSNYSRALKVLNSTAENCDIEAVREKIVDVLGELYGTVRGRGASGLQQFLDVLSNQSHVSSATKAQFERRVGARARLLVEREFEGENYRAAYRLCRTFRSYTAENFEAQYYCGTTAQEVDAQSAAMNSYEWLVQNWNENQSLATWQEIATPLEDLYFLNGRFQEAYQLARRRARRNPSPEAILSSLVSARGKFLSPVLRAASVFYGSAPSQSALSHVGKEMQRVNFPKYVKAFYILGGDGSVERGMYGKEANQPSTSVLEQATGTVSLLQSSGNSNRVWLVSPLDERFLVIEFGIGTTAEENVRLETVHENIENDEQWSKLYDLEFTETAPATGSAVGTLLSAASIDGQNLDTYSEIFDASSLLTYYCVQNEDGGIEESYNFERANLAYGDDEWQRTSNTPALYHHSIKYSGQSVREVVWPKFINEEWTGVVRIALTHN